MANATYSTSLTGLTQGTTYEYRITAIGDGTTYANSATTSASTFKTLTKCATPTVTLTRNTSSFTATWSAVTGATSYTIRYKLSTASTWTTTTSTTTSKTISSLTSGATYYVQVMATTTNSAYVNSDYSTQQSVVIQTKLSTPGSPSITNTTINSITFGWSAVTNATSYTVYYKLSSASSWTSTTTTSTSWTKSSLSEGVTYQFKVKATSSNSNYVESDETTAVSGTTKTTLATPTGLAIARTTNSLTASWSRVSNNSGYTLQYKLSSASSWTSVTRDQNVESYTLPSLQEGKTYQFQVKANGSGNYVDSAYCTAVSATTKITLATPTGLAASNVLSTTATLSWAAVTNATGYLLEIVDSNGTPAAGGAYYGITVTGTTINLTDLEETEQYTVSLIATSTSDNYVNSSAATLSFTTDEKLGTPAAPTLTKGTTWIKASWGAISAADSYNVRYKTGSDAWTTVNVPSGTEWTLSPIAEGATYQFQVQAVTENEAYESSDWSSSSTATTLITLNTPTGLTATDVTINSATIGWTGDDRATQFKIEYRASDASTWQTKTVDA